MGRVAVVGSGRIGLSIAYKLWKDGENIIIIDKDKDKLAYAPENYEKMIIDISEYDDVYNKFPNVDLTITALPGKDAYKGVLNLIKNKRDIVDVSSHYGDMKKIKEYASNSNVLYVPHTGFAPGLSNILAMRLDTLLEEAEDITIYVGGVSEKPDDLLGIALTWSPEDLLNEYINPARIVRDGKIEYVDPLEYVGTIEVPEIGKMEYFASDGLGTLLMTMNHVKNMKELTLRYKGHIEKMRFLREIGILSNDYIEIDNLKISGKGLLLRFLLKNITNTYRDLTILYVVAKKDSRSEGYLVSKKYDEENKMSAMSIMTGYTAAIIGRLYLKNIIDRKDFFPPEYIGREENLFRELEKEYSKEEIFLRYLQL